jgi:hypothetical protein
VRRLLNSLAPRRPITPALPPVEDWSPSDFAQTPEEAWLLADLEIEEEAAEDAKAA